MVWHWDDFVADSDARRLRGPEGDIHVEPQVFDVLVHLITNRQRVVSKAELFDEVWGDQFVSESALTTRIKQARRALNDDGRTQRYIRNVHGRGYQFVGQVEESVAVDTIPNDSSAYEPRERATPKPVLIDLASEIAVDDEFPFVGRVEEMAAAQAALSAGESTVSQIHISGSPGAGKSRLAVELLKTCVDSGRFVGAGRCEISTTSALQPVRDALSMLALSHPDRVAEWTRGLEPQLLSMIPSLVDHLDGEAAAVDVYAGIDVFATVIDRIAADGPLTLLIDDFQWSDEPSRILLDRVGRRLRSRPITVVCTFRDNAADLSADVADFVRRQRRGDHVLRLELGPLGSDDARHLVGAVADRIDEESIEDLLSVTEGHCLFLTESLRDIQQGQDTAASVLDLVTARLHRQPDDVQQVIRAGALLGPEFQFPVAAAVARLEPVEALRAVGQAVEAELLHETASPERFRFSHQLVPEAIVADLPRTDRCSLELACATELEATGADEVEVAFHLLEAVPLVAVDAVVARCRDAAAAARADKQYDRAIRLLDRTLTVEPDVRQVIEILLETGELLNDRGTPAEAIERLERGAELARANGWPDLLARAALAHWGQSPFRKPRDTSTMALLTEADGLLDPGPSVLRARVAAKTAVFNIFRAPMSARLADITRAMEMAAGEGASDLEMLEFLEAQAITCTCPAGVRDLERIDPEIERLRIEQSQYFADAAAPESRYFMRGKGDDFRRVAERDQARMVAQPIAEWRDYVLRSTLAALAGDIDEARSLSDRAGEIGEAFWGESAFALHGFSHFFLDLVSERWERSREHLEMLIAFQRTAIFFAPLALARIKDGDVAGAEELVDKIVFQDLPRFGEHILGGNALVAGAELALLLDHDELAEASYNALEPYHDLMMGVPWAAASLAAADPLSRLARRRGDDEAGRRFEAQARALYTNLEAPALLARLP